jgi:hypothetical protein
MEISVRQIVIQRTSDKYRAMFKKFIDNKKLAGDGPEALTSNTTMKYWNLRK